MDCAVWWAGLERDVSIASIGSILLGGWREFGKTSCISLLGLISGERLANHCANLNSMKWMLWNDGVEMADFGMTNLRIGLFQHALAYPDASSKHFEGIEAKLNELRSYMLDLFCAIISAFLLVP